MQGTDTNSHLDIDEHTGFGLFHKSIINNEKPFNIFLSYQFDRDAYRYCQEENTGGGCNPQRPYEPVPDLDNLVIVNVDGQDLLVPTYNKRKDKDIDLQRTYVYQIIDGRLVTDLTIGTKNPDQQVYGEFFRISIDEIEDYQLWKKEIEPELIQIMKSFKIEKIEEKKPE